MDSSHPGFTQETDERMISSLIFFFCRIIVLGKVETDICTYMYVGLSDTVYSSDLPVERKVPEGSNLPDH